MPWPVTSALAAALSARAWRWTPSFVLPSIAQLWSIRSFGCRRKTGACSMR